MEEKRFRYAFVPLFATIMLTWGIPCFLWQAFWPDEYSSGLILGLTSLPIALGMIFIAPVRVRAASLRCHNFWGINRSVDWDTIESVTPFKLILVRYLRVYHRGGQPLWMPLSVDDEAGLAAALRASPEGPVRRYFEGA